MRRRCARSRARLHAARCRAPTQVSKHCPTVRSALAIKQTLTPHGRAVPPRVPPPAPLRRFPDPYARITFCNGGYSTRGRRPYSHTRLRSRLDDSPAQRYREGFAQCRDPLQGLRLTGATLWLCTLNSRVLTLLAVFRSRSILPLAVCRSSAYACSNFVFRPLRK